MLNREIREFEASHEKQLQEQSVQMRAGGPAPTIRFHEETKLLICAGTASQIDLVPQVLNGLSRMAIRPKEEPKIVGKARSLKIGTIVFKETSLAAAIDAIRTQAQKEDPEHAGINIVLNEGTAADSLPKVNLTLNDVSVMDALSLVAEVTGMKVDVREQVLFVNRPPLRGSGAQVIETPQPPPVPPVVVVPPPRRVNPSNP
jgi:hypothetical protein